MDTLKHTSPAAIMPPERLNRPVADFKVGDEGWISPHEILVNEDGHTTWIDDEAEACARNEDNRLVRLHLTANGFHLYLADTSFCFTPYALAKKRKRDFLPVSEIH